MDSKNWKARLKKIKDYKSAKESADQQGGSLEDGRYKGKITSAQLAESQASGREQINIFGEVTEGESEGTKFSLFPGLDEKSLPFTLSLFNRLGYGIPEQPEDIVDLVTQLNDDQPAVVISVKGGWTNIVGVIEGEEQIGETSDSEDETEEVEETEVEEEETTSEEEVSEGSKVSFDWKGSELFGEVVEILEAENKLVVKDENGKKYKVSAEKASLVSEEKAEEVDEVEEEEVEEEPEQEPEPPTKKGKVMAKATKKAPAKKVSRKK